MYASQIINIHVARSRTRASFTAVCLSLLSSPTIAAAVTYTNETAFLNSIVPTHVESFEDEAATAHATTQTTSYFTATVAPLSGGSPGILIGDSPGWASDGTHYLGGCGGVNSCRIDFVLAFPVFAIGFDVISASEAPTQSGGTSFVRLELPSGEQFVMSSCPPCYANGADYFFGIVSDTPFVSFSIANTAYSDGVAFDRMQLAAVPTPAPLLLLGSALAALATARRFRRHSALT